MATTVGKLRFILTANAGRFNKTLSRAHRTLRTFSRSATRFAFKIGAIGTAITALVAGGSFVALIRNAAVSADELAKTSQKLGLTTEALAGMRFAAKLSGVDVRKLEMGMQRMTRRVSEAAQDTGEAKAAIKELGLDAKKLNMLSPDKMFIEIAKAMQKVGTSGDRVRLAFKLFDSEGVDLVNTLALGGDELERLMEQAKRLGTGLNRIDARKIEMMRDSFVKLREAINGLATQIALVLSPYLSAIADVMFEIGVEGEHTTQKIRNAFRKLGHFLLSWAATEEIHFRQAFDRLELHFRRTVNDLTSILSATTAIVPGLGSIALGGLDKLLTENILAIRDLEKRIETTEDDIIKAYTDLVNKLGDRILQFELKARGVGRDRGLGDSINDLLPGGTSKGTIQGRTRQEGIIGAGGIFGVQKLGVQQTLAKIATNTGITAEQTKKLVQFMGFTDLFVPLVR